MMNSLSSLGVGYWANCDRGLVSKAGRHGIESMDGLYDVQANSGVHIVDTRPHDLGIALSILPYLCAALLDADLDIKRVILIG